MGSSIIAVQLLVLSHIIFPVKAVNNDDVMPFVHVYPRRIYLQLK